MSARASVAFITDQVEETKQRQFVELVPGIVQVRVAWCVHAFSVIPYTGTLYGHGQKSLFRHLYITSFLGYTTRLPRFI